MIAGTLVLALALSGGNHGGGGGGSHPAPAPRSAPAAPRAPAPAPRAQGFNLPHDVPAQHPAAPAQRPAAPAQRPAAPAQRPVTRPVQPMPRYQARPPASGRPIANPHHWTHPWQWNNGVTWSAAPGYWGGGFWGPWALGLAVGAYIVEPDTPGAELLQEYGLTQTPCGPPNLVEIYGPDGSEICAYPNDLVGPGQYDVDPQTLTLVSDQ